MKKLKLTLNKETIASLSSKDLGGIMGGYNTTTGDGCTQPYTAAAACGSYDCNTGGCGTDPNRECGSAWTMDCTGTANCDNTTACPTTGRYSCQGQTC